MRHVVSAQLPLFSAGIAFFAVLSIAPVLVTALSVYGAVNTPTQARDQLAQVAEMLPTNCNRSSPINSGPSRPRPPRCSLCAV
jgi:membrane protein